MSIAEKIAKVFGFRNRMQVIVAEVQSPFWHLILTNFPRLKKRSMKHIMLNWSFVMNTLPARICGV